MQTRLILRLTIVASVSASVALLLMVTSGQSRLTSVATALVHHLTKYAVPVAGTIKTLQCEDYSHSLAYVQCVFYFVFELYKVSFLIVTFHFSSCNLVFSMYVPGLEIAYLNFANSYPDLAN